HGFQRDTEQHQQYDVLDGPEPLMHGEGHVVLGNFQLARGFVDQFLQRAEGAQPAAEHATSPEQDACGGEDPENENHRIGQEQLPAEILYQRMHEGQYVDHRQLPQGIPADEHHGEDQVAMTQHFQEVGVLGELVLHVEDDSQQRQRDQYHADLEALLIPDIDPHRTIGFLDDRQFLGGRQRSFDVFLGNLIGQLETGEDAVYRAGLATHQQLHRPRRTRIEPGMLTNDENGHFLEVRYAFGVEVGETLEIGA